MLSSDNQDAPPRSGAGGPGRAPAAGRCAPGPSVSRPEVGSLVTSRNNSNPLSSAALPGPFREPRPYVQKCGTGTLAISRSSGAFSFGALVCGSWSCAYCRRVLAARLLDRLRSGMESRSEFGRMLVTLTLDPSKFGSRPIGIAWWTKDGKRTVAGKGVRWSRIWAPPTPEQFREASEAMSREWNRLNERLGSKARRAGVDRHGYFRVIELHRSGWPHYHVVIEHPTWTAADIAHQVAGWSLGSITEAQDVSLEVAVGELAPYLVSKERSSSKAYQFAATALPENFRLYSSSKDFLPPAAVQSSEDVDHAQVLRGHFLLHHRAVIAWGAESRIVLPEPAPLDRPHRAPGTVTATGDGARRYYVEQLDAQRVEITPEMAAHLADDST